MVRHLGLVLVAGAWASWAMVPCGAQSTPGASPAPCTVAPQPAPCGTTPAKPKAAEKFPFPGEAAGSATTPTPDAAAPSINGVPVAPDAPGAPSAPAPAGKRDFPFPGDLGKPGASSSSSSSSSGDDAAAADPGTTADADPALKDKGSEGAQTRPGRHLLHRVNPVGTKLQTADEREAEDLDVAEYYLQSGDLQGAYLRSQDAVKTVPDDPDAHFALAEAALKLNKRDEAIAEFNACLKLDPDQKKGAAARKALARLKR